MRVQDIHGADPGCFQIAVVEMIQLGSSLVVPYRHVHTVSHSEVREVGVELDHSGWIHVLVDKDLVVQPHGSCERQ